MPRILAEWPAALKAHTPDLGLVEDVCLQVRKLQVDSLRLAADGIGVRGKAFLHKDMKCLAGEGTAED